MISPEYAPKVVNGLIRYIMHLSSEQKLSEILDLFIRITSTDCDDATVRAIVLTLVAQPKPNMQIDYGISVFILNQLLMQDRLHPVLIKVIKENLIEPDNDTTEILVRTLKRTIKDSQVIKKELYDLVFHVFELGSFWACDEIIHSLIDEIKSKKIVDLEIEHIPYLWARVHKAIYTAYTTPEYHPGYFTVIKSSAELIAVLALTQQ